MKNFNRFGKEKRGFRANGKRDMHHAVCDKCGKDCEVPFRPTAGKPIFCSDCFEKKAGGKVGRNERNYSNDRYSRPDRRDMNRAVCDECGKDCEVPFRPTEGKPVYCSDCFESKGNSRKNAGNQNSAYVKEQFELLNSKIDRIIESLALEKSVEPQQGLPPQETLFIEKALETELVPVEEKSPPKAKKTVRKKKTEV